MTGFLDLDNKEKYPKYKKIFNFYTKKYVFLNPDLNIEEIDLYTWPKDLSSLIKKDIHTFNGNF